MSLLADKQKYKQPFLWRAAFTGPVHASVVAFFEASPASSATVRDKVNNIRQKYKNTIFLTSFVLSASFKKLELGQHNVSL